MAMTNSISATTQAPLSLRRLHLFGRLSENQLGVLWSSVTPLPLRRGATLLLGQDQAAQVGFVASGRFDLRRQASGNVDMVVAKLSAGAPIALGLALGGGAHHCDLRLTAKEAGALLFFPVTTLLALAREVPDFALTLLSEVAAEMQAASQRCFELATLCVRARLIAELARLAEQGVVTGDICVVKGAPSHAELAARIGASRESVTRHLQDLSHEGAVRWRRGVIEFLDCGIWSFARSNLRAAPDGQRAIESGAALGKHARTESAVAHNPFDSARVRPDASAPQASF